MEKDLCLQRIGILELVDHEIAVTPENIVDQFSSVFFGILLQHVS